MLSPNEKTVMIKLKSQDCFGELGIYTTTRRITSFIAADFTLIYILERDVLKEILKAFPQALIEYETFGKFVVIMSFISPLVKEKLEPHSHGESKEESFEGTQYSREILSPVRVQARKNKGLPFGKIRGSSKSY